IAEREAPSDEELEPIAQVLALTAAYYGAAYCCKEACHTSALTGAAWVAELEEGHHIRIFRSFRVTQGVFEILCNEVEKAVPSSPWARIELKESDVPLLPFEQCIQPRSHGALPAQWR
ncbi:hypothetical protein JG688_00018351, partial [Phytophthora aleatoria]